MMKTAFEVLGWVWFAGMLVSQVLFGAFVLRDRRINGTPWNFFSYSSRALLIMALWPLYVVVAVAIAFDLLRRGGRK